MSKETSTTKTPGPSGYGIAHHAGSLGISHPAVIPLQKMEAGPQQEDAPLSREDRFGSDIPKFSLPAYNNSAAGAATVMPFQLKPALQFASKGNVVQLVGRTIRVNFGGGKTHDFPLSELNDEPQDFFYEQGRQVLNSIWAQLNALKGANLDAADKQHRKQLKTKVHNAWEILGHLDRATNGWKERYGAEAGKGDSLHDYTYNAIIEERSSGNTIAGMSHDATFNYKPETQLAYCLEKCVHDSEETLAMSLYTSYFYLPLNSYLRGLQQPDTSTGFGKLLVKTAEVLRDGYAQQAATPITGRRYRLELKSGWISGSENSLRFDALTSTQLNLGKVKAMWSDIAEGKFGAYDNFALLIFEGTAKVKRPHPAKKYFPGETEDLMGPGATYNVIDRYIINGNIPGIGQQAIRVFHLRNVPGAKANVARVSFTNVV